MAMPHEIRVEDAVPSLVPQHDVLEQNVQETDGFSRRDMRVLIFNLLYAAESFDYQVSLESIALNFNHGFDLSIDMDGEVFSTARVVIEKRDEIDERFKELLANWRFDRIGVCTKLILRYAIWELDYTDTDKRIVINESVELAKCFAEKDAYRFINGILDKLAKEQEKKENTTDAA